MADNLDCIQFEGIPFLKIDQNKNNSLKKKKSSLRAWKQKKQKKYELWFRKKEFGSRSKKSFRQNLSLARAKKWAQKNKKSKICSENWNDAQKADESESESDDQGSGDIQKKSNW